ncbi:MAG: capsular biosynthesis protein [Sphingomonadaceae bacterium]|jgi:capsular polysaccharide export protein
MKNFSFAKRRFLFLQGPPGPFFWLLGQELALRGYPVFRINFNGGDKIDWPGESVNYRGGQAGWNRYIDRFIRDNKITDILLFGDCRPLHIAAHGMAKLRGINIHVFEEGYIRPHWVTMEPDGVNGYSTLTRDPDILIEQAAHLPSIPPIIEISASFKRRMRDALRYYLADWFNRWRYPSYKSHRPGYLAVEALGWAAKYVRSHFHRNRNLEALTRIGEAPYFLFPLQLNSDFQIREHSPFTSMYDAVLYVLESFTHQSPEHSVLVIKEHPLDCQLRSWRRFIDREAIRLGIKERVLHVAGGHLESMARSSMGMVTVNSTSGTLGLSAGVPVFVLGNAIYDIPGITHQGILDEFWRNPQPPKKDVYDAFRRVLHARCLVPGGFASESAVKTLIRSTLIRLFEDPAHMPARIAHEQAIANQAATVSLAPVSSAATGA